MYEENKTEATEVQYAPKDTRPTTTHGVGMAEPNKPAPVINEAIAQADIIDGLVNAISRLETSISPVLGTEASVPDGDPSPPRGESKLYSILDRNNTTLMSITQFIHRLTARVEL